LKRVTFFILLTAFSLTLNAANLVDVYGVDLEQSEDLIKNYGSQVSEIEEQFLREMIKISNGGKDHFLP
jgi:hypothetical protein